MKTKTQQSVNGMPPVPRALRDAFIEDFVGADERPENPENFADDLVLGVGMRLVVGCLIAPQEWCTAAGVEYKAFERL